MWRKFERADMGQNWRGMQRNSKRQTEKLRKLRFFQSLRVAQLQITKTLHQNEIHWSKQIKKDWCQLVSTAQLFVKFFSRLMRSLRSAETITSVHLRSFWRKPCANPSLREGVGLLFQSRRYESVCEFKIFFAGDTMKVHEGFGVFRFVPPTDSPGPFFNLNFRR